MGPPLTPPRNERVFFALWPDERLRASLDAVARDWHRHCGGRVTRRENLHLTLVFVGNVDARQFDLLREVTARQPVRPFDLALNSSAWFKRNRIAFAQPAPVPPALTELVAALEGALIAHGMAFDARPYVPHVTLLRNARCAPPGAIEPPLAWRVDALCLVRSRAGDNGVGYEVVSRSGA